MSDITNQQFNEPIDDETPFPFGKHGPRPKGSGLTMKEVPANYLLWLASQPDFADKRPTMADYIEANRGKLEAREKAEKEEYFAEKNRTKKREAGEAINFDDE